MAHKTDRPPLSHRGTRGRSPERIDPLVESSGIVAHHEAKYVFAASLVDSTNVVDVGCGIGYGTEILSRNNPYAVGVDVDKSAVDQAIARYGRQGIAFVAMDAQVLAFKPSSFGAAVCFEAIEHLIAPQRHLAEIVRVLEPGGKYLVSTPQPGRGGSPEHNPFHHHEFTRRKFEELLSGYFSEVRIMGQNRRRSTFHKMMEKADVFGIRKAAFLRPVVRKLSRFSGIRATEDADLTDFVIDETNASAGTEFVAVCAGPRKQSAQE